LRRSTSDGWHSAALDESNMTPPAEGPAIAIRDLAKSYGSVDAVRGVTFDVARGEIFGFLGLNGAGKTTTIRILLDLLRPTRGHAQLFGFDCQRQSTLTRAMVGYMPGELGFYPDMTGLELLDLMARLSGGAIEADRRLQLADRLELARLRFFRGHRVSPCGSITCPLIR
jgi:ABC-2 type transport system ATP-binding protein